MSPDTPTKQARFKEKYNLPFTLLADVEHHVAEKYGAWQEKSFMGRKYMGVERSTVIIDPDGKVAHIFPKVKAAGHAQEVTRKLEELRTTT